MPGRISWYKLAGQASIIPACMHIITMALLCVYDTSKENVVKKTSWYGVTYAVRIITSLTVLITALRMNNRIHYDHGFLRFFYGLHFALILFVACGVVYFDPVTTVLLVAKKPSDIGKVCQGLCVTYLIMVVVYNFIYVAIETASRKSAAADVDDDIVDVGNDGV